MIKSSIRYRQKPINNNWSFVVFQMLITFISIIILDSLYFTFSHIRWRFEFEIEKFYISRTKWIEIFLNFGWKLKSIDSSSGFEMQMKKISQIIPHLKRNKSVDKSLILYEDQGRFTPMQWVKISPIDFLTFSAPQEIIFRYTGC